MYLTTTHVVMSILFIVVSIVPVILVIRYFINRKKVLSATTSVGSVADVESSVVVDFFYGIVIVVPILLAVVYAPKIIIDLFFPFYATSLWIYLLSDLIITISIIAIYCLFFPNIKTRLGCTGFFLIILITVIIHLVWIYHGYTQNKILVKEEQIVIQEYYYTKSQKIIIPAPSETKTPKERLELIFCLSKKVDLLDKSRQYTHPPEREAEYQSAKKRLGLERALAGAIAERGNPNIDVMLTEEGKKHYVFKESKPSYKFFYLSSGEFTGGDDSGEAKCIYSPNSHRRLGSFKGPFYITKKTSSVRVVGWTKK